MRRMLTGILLGAAMASLCGIYLPHRSQPAGAPAAGSASPRTAAETVLFACPGRTEGRSDSVQVAAAADGVIRSVTVREGQTVRRGAALAEIACADLRAARDAALAEAESLRQARIRLVRGSRDEERQAAAQKSLAARAVLQQASAQRGRMLKLFDAQAISRAALDEAQRDCDVAEAQYKGAVRAEELVNAPALAEEIARADADIRGAEQRIAVAVERLEKCVVRAPADGTVLRVHARQGELFSTFSPHPLFTIADLSSLRVRAEVDERDIGKVALGQRVAVLSDSHPGRVFEGRVVLLASAMGRKSILTGEPAEKSDRDILEAVSELDMSDGVNLPVGLRVTVRFLRKD